MHWNSILITLYILSFHICLCTMCYHGEVDHSLSRNPRECRVLHTQRQESFWIYSDITVLVLSQLAQLIPLFGAPEQRHHYIPAVDDTRSTKPPCLDIKYSSCTFQNILRSGDVKFVLLYSMAHKTSCFFWWIGYTGSKHKQHKASFNFV